MLSSAVASVNTQNGTSLFFALEESKILGMTAGYKLQHSPEDLIQDRCGFEVKLLAGAKSRLTIESGDHKVLKH